MNKPKPLEARSNKLRFYLLIETDAQLFELSILIDFDGPTPFRKLAILLNLPGPFEARQPKV